MMIPIIRSGESKMDCKYPSVVGEDGKICFGIWYEVHGDTPGPRHGWLKANGEICRFATRDEAETEAASLNKSMNGQYTVTTIGDTDYF
jgi:hypothetical protein